MVYGVVMYYVKTIDHSIAMNCLKITLILQPASSDVKIDPARAHESGRLRSNTFGKLHFSWQRARNGRFEGI